MIEAPNPRFTAAPGRPEKIVWANVTKLIWHPDEVETHFEQPKNAFCHFRKTFRLPDAEVVSARIRIFADSRYRLSVNGAYVGRGPCRSDPRWQYVDELDATPHVRAGNNAIAVLALHYGYGTGQSIHRIPALVVEADIALASGERLVVSSDESWKCRPAEAYDRTAPRINGCQGPIEIYDSRSALPGWEQADYDDGSWANARGRGTKLSPFWNWISRDIPLLEEGERAAVAVAGRGELTECVLPAARLHHRIVAEEAGLRMKPAPERIGGAVVVEATPRGKAAVVAFDLGGMEAGYLQLRLSGCAGDVVDAVYAERLWQGKALINLSNNRPIDRFILAGGDQELETAFAWRACRYIQLVVRNPGGPVVIRRVGLRTRRYPLADTAVFRCSDERLRRIWDISAHTLHLCMQDGFLDSSSREQQQWMGDGRWQAIVNAHYSGDSRLHRKLLEQIGQSQDWMGMTKARYPDGHHNYPPIPSRSRRSTGRGRTARGVRRLPSGRGSQRQRQRTDQCAGGAAAAPCRRGARGANLPPGVFRDERRRRREGQPVFHARHRPRADQAGRDAPGARALPGAVRLLPRRGLGYDLGALDAVSPERRRIRLLLQRQPCVGGGADRLRVRRRLRAAAARRRVPQLRDEPRPVRAGCRRGDAARRRRQDRHEFEAHR